MKTKPNNVILSDSEGSQKKDNTRFLAMLGMTILLLLMTFPAHAQEEKAPALAEDITTLSQVALEYPIAYRYHPEYCDFTAAFPEQPIITERCEKEDDPKTCYKLVSYTKVFELATTVNVNIVCNPADTEMYEYFTPEVMENTVRKMTEGSVIKTFNVTNSEKEGYRLTGLVGQGRKGLDDTLFIAQLWISEKSIMSVEAEISGHKNQQADNLFAGVLNHVGYAQEVMPKEAEKKQD